MSSTLEIDTVSKFVDTVIKFPNFRYARGEGKEFDPPFLPKVWRKEYRDLDRTSVVNSSSFSMGELGILNQCQLDYLDGKLKDPYFDRIIMDPSREIVIDSEDLLHWAALAQHYRYATRLVDITADLLIALYFAATTHPGENGFIYYFNDNYNELHLSKRVERGDSFFDIQRVYTDALPKYPATPATSTTSIIKPSFPNTRIEAQKAAFCFTMGMGMPAYRTGSLIIEIPSKYKKDITQELNCLGYNENTIFPAPYNF